MPAEVRRKLGISAGTVLEWEEQGESILVRRAGGYSSEEIHRELFEDRSPASRSDAEMREGIRPSCTHAVLSVADLQLPGSDSSSPAEFEHETGRKSQTVL